MIDYPGLHCFCEVLRYASFERAAQALNLTQSAVSQKVKRLEQQLGGPLLIRSKPLKPTPLGQQLLAHAQKVSMLEDSLYARLGTENQAMPITVAVNNDVLATWFVDVLASFSQSSNNLIHVYNADQSQTRTLLQQGDVVACISQTGTPVTGGQSLRLGSMDYQLYASPEFIQRYLAEGISAAAVMRAPGLLYDEYDLALLTEYQRACLGVLADTSHCHWYPSSHGFVKMALSGTVAALLPTLQVQEELSAGRLVALFPDRILQVPLFWHWYELNSPLLTLLTNTVKQVSRPLLNP